MAPCGSWPQGWSSKDGDSPKKVVFFHPTVMMPPNWQYLFWRIETTKQISGTFGGHQEFG